MDRATFSQVKEPTWVQHILGGNARGGSGWRNSCERADHVRARMLADFKALDRKLSRAKVPAKRFDELVDITAPGFSDEFIACFMGQLKTGVNAREAFNYSAFKLFGAFGPTY